MSLKNLTNRKKLFYNLIIFILFIIGAILRLSNFNNDIDKKIIFRQSHIATNIYFLQQNGLFTTPEIFTKNMPNKIFDTPIYQILVAIVSNISNLKIVQAARVTNVLIFLGLYLIIYFILKNIFKEKIYTIIFCLTFFVFSPFNKFYNRALLPDNLGVLFALLSFYFFFIYQQSKIKYYFFLNLFFAILSVLIKNPIYLPFAITINIYYIYSSINNTNSFYRIFSYIPPLFSKGGSEAGGISQTSKKTNFTKHYYNSDLRTLFSKLFKDKYFYSYNISILLTIIIYKIISNLININSLQTPSWEWQWYFGTLAQRLNPIYYKMLAERFINQIGTPILFPFFIIGLLYQIFICKQKLQRFLTLILLLSSLFTIFLFFYLNSTHPYYSLAHIFIYIYISSIGLAKFIEYLLKKEIKHLPNFKLRISILVVFIIAFVYYYYLGYMKHRIYELEDIGSITKGKFIENNTQSDDFIFYYATEDWTPQYLWYAKRYGYNVHNNIFNPDFIEKIKSQYNTYNKYYLYYPDNKIIDEAKSINAKPYIVSKFGTLYEI